MLTPGSLAKAIAGHPQWASEAEVERAEAVEKLTKSARFLLKFALGCVGSVDLEPDEEAEINAAADVIRAAEEWKP